MREILTYNLIEKTVNINTLVAYMKEVYRFVKNSKLLDHNKRKIFYNICEQQLLFEKDNDTDGDLLDNSSGARLGVKGYIRQQKYFDIDADGDSTGYLSVGNIVGRDMLEHPNVDGKLFAMVEGKPYLVKDYSYKKGKIYYRDVEHTLKSGYGTSYSSAKLNKIDKSIELETNAQLIKAFLTIMNDIPDFFNDLEYVKNGLKQLSDMITEVERHLETNKNTNDISVFDSSVKKIKDDLKQAEAALAEEEGKTDKDAGAIAEYKRRVTFYSRKLDREIKKVKDSIQNNIDSLEKLRVFIGRVQAL